MVSVTEPSGEVARWEFRREVIRIGRRHDNDLVLLAPTISREHARLEVREAGIWLVGMATQAEVLVNNAPIHEGVARELQPGDVIETCGYMIRVSLQARLRARQDSGGLRVHPRPPEHHRR
jgi:pSer/pThr/pTyr-binding forkhead associated (FHA) protein